MNSGNMEPFKNINEYNNCSWILKTILMGNVIQILQNTKSLYEVFYWQVIFHYSYSPAKSSLIWHMPTCKVSHVFAKHYRFTNTDQNQEKINRKGTIMCTDSTSNPQEGHILVKNYSDKFWMSEIQLPTPVEAWTALYFVSLTWNIDENH